MVPPSTHYGEIAMSTARPLTPDQVKEKFRQSGQTITEWATARGYKRREVYKVLNGQSKAHYGTAHEIAVALGLKAQADSTREQLGSPASRRRAA
jgi:gp16 family phage-associated protein